MSEPCLQTSVHKIRLKTRWEKKELSEAFQIRYSRLQFDTYEFSYDKMVSANYQASVVKLPGSGLPAMAKNATAR